MLRSTKRRQLKDSLEIPDRKSSGTGRESVYLYFNPVIVLPFVAIYFGALLAYKILINEINSHWPPVNMAAQIQQAVSREAAALDEMTSPNVGFTITITDLNNWLLQDINNAVAKEDQSEAGKANLQLSNTQIHFGSQSIIIESNFILDSPKYKVHISGLISGRAIFSHEGTKIIITPRFDQLFVHSLKFDRLFLPTHALASALSALLFDFRDNINGVLQSYNVPIPIAPIGQPGHAPKPVTISFQNPFEPHQAVALKLVPPTIKSWAFILDSDRIEVLVQLSIEPIPAPVIVPAEVPFDFSTYKQKFLAAASRLGLPSDSSNHFVVAPSFSNAFVDAYVDPVFARDRLSAALEQSMAELSLNAQPDVAFSLSTPIVQADFQREINQIIPKWATVEHIRITEESICIIDQAIQANITADVPIFGGRGVAGVHIALIAPISGGTEAIALYPAIDKVRVTHLDSTAFHDLDGLLFGLNTILASAVSGANGFLLPIPVGITPISVPAVDTTTLSSGQPGLEVSPASISLPPVVLDDVSILLDRDRIWAMAHWSQGDELNPQPLPQGTTSFTRFRDAYLKYWSDNIDQPMQRSPAAAYIRTASIAKYTENAINTASLSILYSGISSGENVTPVMIADIPSPHCHHPVACPACKKTWKVWEMLWDCSLKLSCEALQAPILETCNVGAPLVTGAINTVVNAMGRRLGDLNVKYTANYGLAAQKLTLDVAPDLSKLSVNATIGGNASAYATLHLNANSFSGRLVCPADLNWRFPIGGGAYNLAIPTQQIPIGAAMATSFIIGANNAEELKVHMSIDQVTVSGEGSPFEDEVLAASAGISIQCPVIGAVSGLPGVSTVLSVLDLAELTGTAFPDLMKSALAGVNSDTVQEIFGGKFQHSFNLGSIDETVQLPQFQVLGSGFATHAALGQQFLRIDAVAN